MTLQLLKPAPARAIRVDVDREQLIERSGSVMLC